MCVPVCVVVATAVAAGSSSSFFARSLSPALALFKVASFFLHKKLKLKKSSSDCTVLKSIRTDVARPRVRSLTVQMCQKS